MYSVLVVGCDNRKKLLDRFFLQFMRFWRDSDVEIFVAMEEDDYSVDGLNIHVTRFGRDWSLRVKNTLECMDRSAVLLLLDDFLIESPVDHEELDRLAALIESDSTIAHFALTTVPMRNQSNTHYYDKYFLRHHFGRYKTTLQAGMWNREELLYLLKPRESAWSFETLANYRSYLSDRKYYAIAKKEWKPIDYNEGLFCIQGKLNTQELSRLMDKFHEDFRIDGMEDNGGIIIRDPCPFFKRVTRRLKLTVLDVFYRVRWMLQK